MEPLSRYLIWLCYDALNNNMLTYIQVAIIGGSSPGMEVWNPSDGSVQKIFDEVPPEENDSNSLDFGQLLAINCGSELLLYGGNQVFAQLNISGPWNSTNFYCNLTNPKLT